MLFLLREFEHLSDSSLQLEQAPQIEADLNRNAAQEPTLQELKQQLNEIKALLKQQNS